jgi:hypothetical protein
VLRSDQPTDIALRVTHKYGWTSGRENTVDLARDNQSLQSRQKADEMRVSRRETVAQELLGLVALKEKVIEALGTNGIA